MMKNTENNISIDNIFEASGMSNSFIGQKCYFANSFDEVLKNVVSGNNTGYITGFVKSAVDNEITGVIIDDNLYRPFKWVYVILEENIIDNLSDERRFYSYVQNTDHLIGEMVFFGNSKEEIKRNMLKKKHWFMLQRGNHLNTEKFTRGGKEFTLMYFDPTYYVKYAYFVEHKRIEEYQPTTSTWKELISERPDFSSCRIYRVKPSTDTEELTPEKVFKKLRELCKSDSFWVKKNKDVYGQFDPDDSVGLVNGIYREKNRGAITVKLTCGGGEADYRIDSFVKSFVTVDGKSLESILI